MHAIQFRLPSPELNLFGELPLPVDPALAPFLDWLDTGDQGVAAWRVRDRIRIASRCAPRRAQRRTRSSHRTVARVAQKCSTSSDPDGEPSPSGAFAIDGGQS